MAAVISPCMHSKLLFIMYHRLKMVVNSRTKLTCLIGHPISHSISPLIHNTSYRDLGLNAIYLAFDVIDLPKALRGLEELGAIGCNITIPHKELAQDLMSWLSDSAEQVGAVNTVKFDDGLLGYNTDVSGVIYSLNLFNTSHFDRVLLLGAGGAARSVLAGIFGRANRVYVTSRRIKRARGILSLCSRLGLDAEAIHWEEREKYVGKVDLLVNATPLGTLSEEIPINPKFLKPGCHVFDLVYNPPKTHLVKEAIRMGCEAVGGVPMLIRQASESEKIWFGANPNEEIMMRAAIDYLGD